MREDARCGFRAIGAREVERVGVKGIIDAIRDRVKGTKMYISVDIDVLDPAFAPGMLENQDFQVSKAELIPDYNSNRNSRGGRLVDSRTPQHPGWLGRSRNCWSRCWSVLVSVNSRPLA